MTTDPGSHNGIPARRRWLRTSAEIAGSAALASTLPAAWWYSRKPVLTVDRPGMQQGHAWRDLTKGRAQTYALPNWRDLPASHKTEVLIVGSGAAAWMCAWRLNQQGHQHWLMLTGPERFGNLAAASTQGISYPTGAHYLPLPSRESHHVRELLADLGVIEQGAQTDLPSFDERALVHAPESRVWDGGQWHEGLIADELLNERDHGQHEQFQAWVHRMQTLRGADGRKVFAVPITASSHDPQWTALDQQPFADWLHRQGFTSPRLLAYIDYCCRDDYGAGLAKVSAWAGLHYFCARAGRGANAQAGAVLTWPDGLAELARRMQQRADPTGQRQRAGMALSIDDSGSSIRVLSALSADPTAAPAVIQARHVVLATPLPISLRLTPALALAGMTRDQLPARSDWLVGTALFDGYPTEKDQSRDAMGLAWDSIVAGSPALGWVHGDHQRIQLGRPATATMTCYRSYEPGLARQYLAQASAADLADDVLHDLRTVYGHTLQWRLKAVHMTVRGHAMAVPTPGFLSNKAMATARSFDQRLILAHADLSGYSVFEEAAWWGDRAARLILQG